MSTSPTTTSVVVPIRVEITTMTTEITIISATNIDVAEITT